tara:strand:+ start:385 stop:612 length:228 start_codon:yes stop_codon:yes gene_type:complete
MMKNKEQVKEEIKHGVYRYTDETNYRFDDAYESVYEYDDDANAYVYLMSYPSADIDTTQALATKVRLIRQAMAQR